MKKHVLISASPRARTAELSLGKIRPCRHRVVHSTDKVVGYQYAIYDALFGIVKRQIGGNSYRVRSDVQPSGRFGPISPDQWSNVFYTSPDCSVTRYLEAGNDNRPAMGPTAYLVNPTQSGTGGAVGTVNMTVVPPLELR
jgi:hypothetical protein